MFSPKEITEIINELCQAAKDESQIEAVLFCAVKSCLLDLDEANKIGEEYGVEL